MPATFAVLFALYVIAPGALRFGTANELTAYLGWELAAGYLWTLIVAVWAQAGGKSRWEQFLATSCGLAAIVILLTGTKVLHTSPVLMILTLLLVLTLAAHHKLERQNDAFWQYNQQLWLGAALSIMSVLAMVVIPLALAASIEYLFAYDLPDGIYQRIFLGCIGLLAPIFWLALIPDKFEPPVDAPPQAQTIGGTAEMLVTYVLVPVMLINTLVLYRYGIKIWIDGVMPPGRLGPVVLAYGALGIVSYVMAYPRRHTGGILVRAYWRGWFIMAIGPAALLALALYRRIEAFGLTEARYIQVLVALWLLGLSFSFIVLRVRDLRFIPASLAALSVLGTFGPPGATGLSIRSQSAQLEALLQRNGLLRDGVFTPASQVPFTLLTRDPGAITLISGDDGRVRSILDFLDERGALGQIAPWFKGQPQDPFARPDPGSATSTAAAAAIPATPAGRSELVHALARVMGARHSPIAHAKSRSVVFYARAPALIALKNTVRLAGPVNLLLRQGRARGFVDIAPGTGRDLEVVLDERQLVIRDRHGQTAIFDLARTAKSIAWFEDAGAVVPALTKPRIIKPSGGQLDLRLAMTSLQGQRTFKGRYAFRQMSFWILIYKK